MSYIEPPTLTNLRKRKRSARSVSVTSSIVSHLPADTIDPHSYGPLVRNQLAVAGLSHSSRLPGDYIVDFPHRPLPDGVDGELGGDDASSKRRGGASNRSDDDDDDDDDDELNIDTDYSEDFENDAWGANDATEDKDAVATAAAAAAGDESERTARRPVDQRKMRRREARRRRNALRTQRMYDQNIGVLVVLVQRGLQEAEHGTAAEDGPIGLARAKRAFGLLLRTQVLGHPVDLRRSYLWAMGAEILMREGEDREPPDERGHHFHHHQRRRWGLAENMPRVKAYYEDLIQQYPYNRLWPRSVSALTFWPAMVGTELYNIYAEAQLAMQRLDEKEEQAERRIKEDADTKSGSIDRDVSDVDSVDDIALGGGQGPYDAYHDAYEDDYREDENSFVLDNGGGGGGDEAARHMYRLRNHPNRLAREDVRLAALDQVRAVARSMDAVMANAPYTTSPEMLRLRGMVSLYMGDLSIVTPPRMQEEDVDGERMRADERARARGRFAQLLEVDKYVQSGRLRRRGGIPDTVVDDYIREIARSGVENSSDDDDEDMEDYSTVKRPVFTSLPIRNT